MQKVSILIVDDNEIDREILANDLSQLALDMTIHEETDGGLALQFLKNRDCNADLASHDAFPPQIIFLDINMPVVDGFLFSKKFAEMRDVLGMQKLIIFMFTSSERKEDQKKYCAYEFVKGCILKGQHTPDTIFKSLSPYLVTCS